MTSTSDDARYGAVLERLQSLGRFGINLGLDRTRSLLRELGDPHVGLRGALIGGTNGKGSVQQVVASVLRQAGYRVGQTPKPHLVTYRERITVDGEPISRAEFADLVDEVLDHADAVAQEHGAPTEFEVLTAAAFAWFRRVGVDVAVIEVGLGGRLDATNVWNGGVAAITNVALDHTEHLGPTIEAIAIEKAAIIKGGDRAAITGAEEPALTVIRRRAADVAVRLETRAPLEVVGMDRTGTVVRTDAGAELRVGLLGRHQAANASVALGIIGALDGAEIASVSSTQIERGFENARWPGRLELLPPVDGRPEVLLDGAHNPHGAAALAAALDELGPQLSDALPCLLLGVVRDKDVAGVVDALRSSAFLSRARVITTDVPDTPRALPAAELAAMWPGATAIDEADEALEHALADAGRSGGIVVVAGSLYLVGHVRAQLLGLETD